MNTKTNKNKHKAYLIYRAGSCCCVNAFDNECSLIHCLRNNGMFLKAKQRIDLRKGRKVDAYDFTFVMEFLD